jgi:GxxExxY protein
MGLEELQIEAFEGANSMQRGREVPVAWNELSRRVIGAALRVHTALGPGLLERVYEAALKYELSKDGIGVESQVLVLVQYDGHSVGELRLDMVIEGKVVVELKATEGVSNLHLAQLVSYLRAGHYALGLLINFNVPLLKQGLYRRLNSDALPP